MRRRSACSEVNRVRKALGISASVFALATALVMAIGVVASPSALAQPKRAPRGAKPKPPVTAPATTSADAGAPDPSAAPDDTTPAVPSGDAGASGSGSGSGSGPTAAPAIGDGGQRMSPLNPAPNEFAGASPTPPGVATIDYDKLLGDIAALRARVASVGDNLFQSRIALSVRTEGNHAKIERLVVGLDDGAVYTAAKSFRAEDATTVYDHAVAPGKHAVTIDIERRDDRDESFRTSQRSRFVVDVPKDHRLELEVRISDDSGMGDDFPKGMQGQYDLRVRARATARLVKK